METVIEKQASFYEKFKEQFGYSNVMAAPQLTKIVVASGTGKRSRNDRHFNELVSGRLALITGQKPAIRAAKKSVATFRVREGDPIGQQVTLRGARMTSFFDKLVHIALPRTRDFRGVKRTSVDPMGNMTIGIKEHTIFPATANEDLKDVFGLGITIVTTAKTREEAEAFLGYLGVPFQKKSE